MAFFYFIMALTEGKIKYEKLKALKEGVRQSFSENGFPQRSQWGSVDSNYEPLWMQSDYDIIKRVFELSGIDDSMIITKTDHYARFLELCDSKKIDCKYISGLLAHERDSHIQECKVKLAEWQRVSAERKKEFEALNAIRNKQREEYTEKLNAYNKFMSFYKTKEFLNLKSRVFYEQKGICQCCGQRASDGHKMFANHIKPRSTNPELELDINNLWLLCEDCFVGKSVGDEPWIAGWPNTPEEITEAQRQLKKLSRSAWL